MTVEELLISFRASFYSVWFTDIPDTLVTPAITEIVSERESKFISGNCPKQYGNYIIYKTVLLLNSSGLSVSYGAVVAPSLNTSVKQQLLKDKVGTTERSFYKVDKNDVTQNGKETILTSLSEKIKDIEDVCKKSSSVYGIVSGGSNYTNVKTPSGNCGHG